MCSLLKSKDSLPENLVAFLAKTCLLFSKSDMLEFIMNIKIVKSIKGFRFHLNEYDMVIGEYKNIHQT